MNNNQKLFKNTLIGIQKSTLSHLWKATVVVTTNWLW